ncbi:MAG: helix-turn-helix transcriptional regulator [Clostridia bacterium]|nr:helix-turn-helix transcriptional regulator [Clostridia bacterium]
MLNENLKILRKKKGLSQEELALQLCVVRQTVSKWEKGLSVPDSEMLIKIAEEFDTTVASLLGEPVSEESGNELAAIAAKLELINEQLAERNKKIRRAALFIFILIGVFSLSSLLFDIFELIYYTLEKSRLASNEAVIGGYVGSTGIYVSNILPHAAKALISIAALVLSAVGICRMKGR